MRTDSAPATTSLTLLLLLTHSALFAQDNGDSGARPLDELAEVSLQGTAADDADEGWDYDSEDEESLAEAIESGEDRLQRLFTLYRNAVNDGAYAEADTLAKQIVELAIELNGVDSRVTARAITNLAIAQHGAEDYDSAQLNFVAAIDIIERISDRLNEDLINPLKGLAATELAQGNATMAAETYQRAMHISHVNFGPHNLDQIELLESLAETLLSAGEFSQAEDMQKRIFALQARNYSRKSEDLLPALLHQARWMNRLQLFEKERHTWRRIISILEEQRGKQDLSLIAPLIGLGNSFLYVNLEEPNYYQSAAIATGEIYLKRAVRIAEKNPEADWLIKSQTMIELADYYLLTDKINRAMYKYRDAWEIMSADESRHAQRDGILQSLEILQDISPPRIYGVDTSRTPGRQPAGFEIGTLEYQYTLSARGRVTDIELIDANPQGLEDLERKVTRELRTLIRRPKIIESGSVQTREVTYKHEFYYRPSDLPDAEVESDETIS